MSIWQRLFGTRPTAPGQAAPLTWQEELEGGKLTVVVTRHPLGLAGHTFPCWTYVTRGLEAAGQKEMVFTLACLPNETEFPRDPLPLFARFQRLAEQGCTVEENDYTCFRSPGGFLGSTEQTGFIYTRAERVPNVDMPAGAIAAILLTPEEAEIVPVIGAYRVMTLLGQQAKFYPCPTWSERGRASVLTRADMEASFLVKTPLAVYPGATARLRLPSPAAAASGEDRLRSVEGGRIILRLPLPHPDGFRDTMSRLGDEWTLALLLKPDPAADVRLVWSPQRGEGQTIAAADHEAGLVTGGFLILGASASSPTGGRVAEDGFTVLLGPTAQKEVRRALVDAESLHLAGEAGMLDFGIDWLSTAVETARSTPGFNVQRIVYYQPEETRRTRVQSVEAFATWLRRIGEASTEFWESMSREAARPVLLVVAVKPGGEARFWVDATPSLELLAVSGWLSRLEHLPVPVVTGLVAVALEAALWGDPSVKGGWPFMPAEWQAACDGRSLLVPDGVLEIVWP